MCRDKDEVSNIPDMCRDELRSGIYDIPGMRWEEENIENIPDTVYVGNRNSSVMPDICGDEEQIRNIPKNQVRSGIYLTGKRGEKKQTINIPDMCKDRRTGHEFTRYLRGR